VLGLRAFLSIEADMTDLIACGRMK
jgi:hypothetical protein